MITALVRVVVRTTRAGRAAAATASSATTGGRLRIARDGRHQFRIDGYVRAGFVSTIAASPTFAPGVNTKCRQPFVEEQLIDAGKRRAVEPVPWPTESGDRARESRCPRRRRDR